MTTAQVVHASDLGAGLEVAGGKVVPSASMTTDTELDVAAQAARDAAIAAAATDAQAKADASQAAATAAAQAMVDASNATGAAVDAAQDAAAITESTSDNVTRMAQSAFTHNWTVDVTGAGIRLRSNGNGLGNERGVIMGAGRGSHAASAGFWDVHAPVAGQVIKGLGTADVVVDADGYIPNVTPAWAHLYLRMPPAGSPNGTPVEWVRATFNEGNYEITDDLILIGTINHDEGGGPYFQLADGTKCFIGTTYPDSPWIALPFASGVTDFGNGHQTCQYRRLNNRVYVRGLCEASATGFGGTGNALLAVLPEGFRPPARLIKCVNHHEGVSRLDIESNGSIRHNVSNTAIAWVPLEFDFDLLG